MTSAFNLLRPLDELTPPATAEDAKNRWQIAWSKTVGFPNLSAGEALNGAQYEVTPDDSRYFTDADFWEKNLRRNIRCSGGHLDAVYQDVLWENGIREANGERVWLDPVDIPAGNYFA